MHHVPSDKNRLKVLQNTRKLLNRNGITVVTTWMYRDIPRLQRRIIDSTTKKGEEIFNRLNLDPDELEDNDSILDWQRGRVAYRYSHYAGEKEMEKLVERAGFKILDTYYSDGKEENVNRYYILGIS
jgi:hypothetical protein